MDKQAPDSSHKNMMQKDGQRSAMRKDTHASLPLISEDVKAMGSKARARLEEEKQNRREIRVLPNDPIITNPNQVLTAAKRPRGSSQLKRPSRKRSRGSTSRKAPPSASRAIKKVDWEPKISHLVIDDKNDQSCMVQLHGVPVEGTLELVQRFFVGLALQYVSVLLPNDTHIASLDAGNPPPPITLCDHHRIRIVAKFPDISTAELAMERSGETIRMGQTSNYDDGEDQEEEEEFAIFVTMIPKHTTEELSKLVVRAVPHVPFAKVLSGTIEGKLHPMVGPILWSLASQSLPNKLPLDTRIQRGKILATDHEQILREELGSSAKSTKVGAAYRQLVLHYNDLVDLQDNLLHQEPYLAVNAEPIHDPHSMDPILRLTTAACKGLVQELDRLEALLYQARISFRFL